MHLVSMNMPQIQCFFNFAPSCYSAQLVAHARPGYTPKKCTLLGLGKTAYTPDINRVDLHWRTQHLLGLYMVLTNPIIMQHYSPESVGTLLQAAASQMPGMHTQFILNPPESVGNVQQVVHIRPSIKDEILR